MTPNDIHGLPAGMPPLCTVIAWPTTKSRRRLTNAELHRRALDAVTRANEFRAVREHNTRVVAEAAERRARRQELWERVKVKLHRALFLPPPGAGNV